jgi:hypothetical protein
MHNVAIFPEAPMADSLDDFQKSRAERNEEILNCGHLGVKRFFALEHQAYDALNVALVVGGSIAIPHVRRAFARMREIQGLQPEVE